MATGFTVDVNNNIVRVNVQTKNSEVLVSDVELKSDISVNFDYETGYIYYYVSYVGDDDSTGYYLNRTYINQTEKENELVGVMLDEHIKTEDAE